MAESVIIHFGSEDPDRIIETIERQFVSSSDRCWRFPVHEYLVMVSEYTDYEGEYDSAEKSELRAKLGGDPTVSFDFIIRRSRSDDACDMLEMFVRIALSNFNFVVDDMFRLLSREELVHIEDFLDVYRYKKTAEQDMGGQNK